MARRNRQAVDRDPSSLDQHTPSSPSRPPVVCIYCRREDNPDKVLIVPWATWEGAASFFEAVVQDQEDEPRWLKQPESRFTELAWSSGLRVRCGSERQLEKLCDQETDVEMSEPYLSQIAQFLSDAPVVGEEHTRRPKERSERGEKKPREKKAPREKKTPDRPAGFVHVSELVPDVEPPHARAALRSLKWEKPSYGWWFDPSRAKEVSKAIKGALK